MPGNQPNAGILPRLPHLEGGLVPPAQKAALPRLSASIGPLPPEKAGAGARCRGGLPPQLRRHGPQADRPALLKTRL